MANILLSRAGGLLSLEGRSLLFSSYKASIAYAKGRDVEMAWRAPVSLPRILWSQGPVLSIWTLGSKPPSLAALLPPWKYTMAWWGLTLFSWREGHIIVFPLQAHANGGLFSFRSNYALEGRSSLFSLPEGKWSLSWQPSEHTPNPALTLPHMGMITRTFLLPSSSEWYAEVTLGEFTLL